MLSLAFPKFSFYKKNQTQKMNRQFINENGHLEIIKANAKSIDKELVFPGSYRYMEDVTILKDTESKVTSVQRTKDIPKGGLTTTPTIHF